MKMYKVALVVCGALVMAQTSFAYHNDEDSMSNYTDDSYVEQVYDSYAYITLRGGLATSFSDHWAISSNSYINTLTSATKLNQPTEGKSYSFMPNIAFGYKFPESPVSIDVAYFQLQRNYHWNKMMTHEAPVIMNLSGDSDLTSQLFMFNGYWNFYTNTNFVPYVGAGVGLAVNHTKNNFQIIDVSGSSDKATATHKGLVLGAVFGLRYAISKHFALNAAVNYFHINRAEINVQTLKDLNQTPFLVSGSLNVISGLVGIDVRF